MKITAFLLFSASLMGGPIFLFSHPNTQVQLPNFLGNETGIGVSDLERQFPQNSFAFSGPLILYFDPVLPSTQVVVTTPRVAWTAREETESLSVVVPPVVPPIIPPTTPPVVPPVVIPPHHPCYHDCHPIVPPATEIPEPNTLVMVSVILGGLFIFLRYAKRK